MVRLVQTECKCGSRDVITSASVDCTVASTWTNDNCECHTLRAWGSRVCMKQRAPQNRCGFTRQPESPNVHMTVPAFKNTTKNSTRRPLKEGRKNETCGGRGENKKSEILGGPAERGSRRGEGGPGGKKRKKKKQKMTK